MIKQLLALVLAGVCSNAYAQRAQECYAPEQMARLKEKLARYDWSTDVGSAATPTGLAYFPQSLIGAFRTSCVAIAVDETGKVKDAVVYYPRNARLSRGERNEYIRSAFKPGLLNGVATPSIVIMAITESAR